MRLRVAHTITRLAGGPAYRTDILLRYLDPARFDVRLYYGATSGWDPDSHDEIVRSAPYPCIFIPPMQREIRPLQDFATLGLLSREFSVFRPHIVHTHESKDGVLARAAALAHRVPVILRHYHGFIYGEGYFGRGRAWMTPFFLGVERLFNRAGAGILNISATLDRLAVEQYRLAGAQQTFVLHNAFDLEPYRRVRKDASLRMQWGIPRKSRVFLMVANFQRPKNHAGALHAFALFRQRHPKPDPYLVLAGQGPLEAEIRRQAEESGISGNVVFLGHRKDIWQVLSGADVFVMSSTSEGTPGALIEALAARVPSACTDVGGISDITANGARAAMAPPWDDEKLCSAMERAAFEPPDMDAVSDAIAQEYGAHAVAWRLMEHYERLWAQVRSFS